VPPIKFNEPVGSIALRARAGFIAAVSHRIWTIDARRQSRVFAAVGDAADGCRLNDGKVGPDGRFWVGTMALDERSPVGALYAFDRSGKSSTMLEGVTVSNGLDWSPDARTFYYVDSPTRRVDAFDFDLDTGEISNRRPFVTADLDAEPDGLTVDSEGYVWVAYWGGWCVRRYSPRAQLDQEIVVPASQVTSCTFGGKDLGELYITTASDGLRLPDLDTQPHAGGVFAARPGSVGLAARLFGA
jgi:sugar lactone lactonase YvrE